MSEFQLLSPIVGTLHLHDPKGKKSCVIFHVFSCCSWRSDYVIFGCCRIKILLWRVLSCFSCGYIWPLFAKHFSVFLFVICLFVTRTFMHFSGICRTAGLKILVSWNLLIYLVPPKYLICLCLLIQLSYLMVGSSACWWIIMLVFINRTIISQYC